MQEITIKVNLDADGVQERLNAIRDAANEACISLEKLSDAMKNLAMTDGQPQLDFDLIANEVSKRQFDEFHRQLVVRV